MKRRVYEQLRSAIEAHGGTMGFIKQGYHGGAWLISLEGKEHIFPSTGRGFDFDRLYTPDPELTEHNHYSHYIEPLLPDAIHRLRVMMG